MQAIILAAGMGKRLKELTRDNTKCMVKVSLENMWKIRDKYLYNVSHSTEVGAKYIIKWLIEMSKR